MHIFSSFRYKEDIIPVFLILLLSIADFFVWFFAESLITLLLWLALVSFPKVCVCAWNHHHQHCSTFKSVILNRILEFFYSLHTGITTNAWVLHHNLGHHVNYLDQEKDESAWKDTKGRQMGVFRYTLTIAATGYTRAIKVGSRYPKHLKPLFKMATLVTLFLGILFYLKPFSTLTVFLVPMLWGYLATCWHTYFHHAGLEADNHMEASYSITHRWYNILTGNLGYHAAHHAKPGLHWSKLPDYHSSIEKEIPKELYREPGIPFKWFPG